MCTNVSISWKIFLLKMRVTCLPNKAIYQNKCIFQTFKQHIECFCRWMQNLKKIFFILLCAQNTFGFNYVNKNFFSSHWVQVDSVSLEISPPKINCFTERKKIMFHWNCIFAFFFCCFFFLLSYSADSPVGDLRPEARLWHYYSCY